MIAPPETRAELIEKSHPVMLAWDELIVNAPPEPATLAVKIVFSTVPKDIVVMATAPPESDP
jgi:hypothetical protein